MLIKNIKFILLVVLILIIKNIKFILLVVSIIIINILIYTIYSNLDIDIINMCICKHNPNSVSENNISFGDLLNLADAQKYVQVPFYGYDLTNPIVFFSKINQRNCVIYAQPVDGVFVNCIEVHNTIYTVHPDLIKLLLHLNNINIPL